jgi:hypothetical protein
VTIDGHIENGQIVLNQEISLPEGMKVRVELLSDGETTPKADAPPGTQFEHYKSIIGAIDDLPSDFAAQHDHYVHGTPKSLV